jgi:acetylornithine/succinyldiaminopimelate/putrescine aminotransferase
MTVTGEALRCNILRVDPHLLWSSKYLGGGLPKADGGSAPTRLKNMRGAAAPLGHGKD